MDLSPSSLHHDGVAICLPLGVSLENFYMIDLENRDFLNEPSLKPNIYCRDVEDFFMIVESVDQLERIVNALRGSYVLNFTTETSINQIINFFDVKTDVDDGCITTMVHRRATN